jgi:hypothetical protein
MKIPRFCSLSDTVQGTIFIGIGALILLNTLNIRLMNFLVFLLALFLIFYGLIALGWMDKLLSLIRKK